MKTKGDHTRQRILETAAHLFWQQSYHGLNMNAISDAAGVNKATIYGYFSSKEDLAIATIQSNQQQAKTCIFDPCLQQVEDPLKQLEWIYHAIYRRAQQALDNDGSFPGCPFINIAMELATVNPTVRGVVQSVFNEQVQFYRTIVKNAISRGLCSTDINIEQTAKGLVATMNGSLVMAKIHNSPQEILAMLPVAQNLLAL